MSKIFALAKFAFVCLALLCLSPEPTFGAGHAKWSVAEGVEGEVNLSDYGAVGDGATDDGPALQRALEAVRARGGGVLRVPAGRYAIRTPVSVDFSARPLSLRLLGVPSDTRVDTSFTADVLTRGLHLSSEFYPMTGEAHTALRLSGLASLDVRDLAFVGTPGLFTDAHTTLDFDRVAQATVYHCEFYGLRTEAHGGAIISAARSRLRVEQSMFLGSFGYSALYVPVIQNLEWEDIHVTSTIFADYGQRPGFHGKTQGATFSWVTAGDPAAPTPAAPRREVVIRDVIFDEGAMFGLFAQPSRYRAPAPAIDLILISDLFQNVSNLGTAGTLIYEARGALIERSHYGYSRYTSGAVDLRGVSAAVIDRVECVDSADLIRADAATGQLSVINSVYRDVVSQAAVTRRLQGVADEDDPVWYVRREYAAALGREPEPSEHFYWSQRLLECGDATGGGTGAAACVRAGRAALAAHLAARPAPTFALTGKVTDEGGAPLAGVTVTLMAGAHPLVSARTDERGEYRFDALPTSGDYTVTAAKDYYRMEPEAHALVAPTGGRRADFAAAARTFAVRGRVVTTNNYGFGGVTVTLTGGATGERVTDAEGYFTFAGLAGLRTYTVTPRLAHHTFEAAAHTTGTLVSDQTLSFSGRLNRYGVSGRVVDGRGRAVVGASVTLTGAQAGATTTDAGGRYAFAGLAATSGYTVTVTGAAGTTFTPAARTYASLTGDEAGGDFTALYSIRGRVTEAGTGGGTGGGGTGGTVSGLAGVTMRLSGTQAATTVTDAGGYYAFANLAAGGNYTVTGEAAHYTLTPGGASHAALGAPQVSDFVATRRRHQIAGRVADGAGAALSGVTVTLTATTPGTTTTGTTTTTTTTATTDAAGNYAFANLLAGYNYAVTAARTHYTFSPATLGFNNLGANATAHFTGTLKRYAVGGRVTIATTGAATGAESLPLAGVTVTLTGAHATATATTDAAGNYTFAAVAAGGAYALAAAKAGYALTPARRVVDELTADRAEHFAATLERYELTGRVVNVNNYGLGGIGVRLTGGRGGETQTDAEGYFTFAGVEALGTYTVTPSLRFHTMTPQAQTFAGLTGGQRMSFIARLDSHTVGGRVTEVGGQAVGGVSVTLTDARQPQQPQTTLTDASGNYSFPNLPAGASYVVTPTLANHTFAPTGASFPSLSANQTANFTASLNSHAIGGRVTDGDGKPLVNVTLSLAGARSSSVVSDVNGNYTFPNLPAGSTYTVTPALANYTFAPSSRTFGGLSADQKADFGGTPILHKISGRINVGADGLAGVTITLSGSRSGTTMTDANGVYTFADLPAGGNYLVTPSRINYGFNPGSLPFNNLSANQTGDFAATLNTHTLGGRIVNAAGNANLSGVTVMLTGARQQTTTTDAGGNYSFPNLPAGASYVVTPALTNYTFSPGSLAFTNLDGDRAGANFSGTLNRYFIGGRVADVAGAALAGVSLELRGDHSATTTTDASGTYSFPGLPAGGNYNVAASKQNFTFTPPLKSFASLGGDQPGADFRGEAVPKIVQFGQPSYQASEGSARATLVVTRTGDLSEAATVAYLFEEGAAGVPCITAEGAANARCDYHGGAGIVAFAPDEATGAITIPLIDDAHVEGAETLRLRLSSATGATLGAQSAVTLIIQDNDTAAAQNPIFTTPFFIRMQYLDFLSREPEVGEPWSAILDGCAGVDNPACDRIAVSQSFFGSPEFRLKGFYAFNFYRVAFGRRPTYEEIIPDMRSITGTTTEETYRKRAAFPVSFTQSAEFKELYDAVADGAFVNALMDRYGAQQITTHDPANPEGGAKVVLTRAELVGRLSATGGAASLTRAQVLRAVVESDEVAAAEYNRAFVAMQYYGYLRRSPEEEGYQAWLRVIARDPDNIRIMVDGFMNSTEYQLRFGSPKTAAGDNVLRRH
jgi:hypothetical protein